MVNFQDPKTRKMLMIGGVVLVVIIIIIVVVMSRSKSKSHADKAKAAAAQAQIHAKKATTAAAQAQIHAKKAADQANIANAASLKATGVPAGTSILVNTPTPVTFKIRVAVPVPGALTNNYLGIDTTNVILVNESDAVLWQLDKTNTLFTIIGSTNYMMSNINSLPKVSVYDPTSANRFILDTFNTTSYENKPITAFAIQQFGTDINTSNTLIYYGADINTYIQMTGMANVVYKEIQ